MAVLSIYFILAQKFTVEYRRGLHIDRRYDNFWASVLSKDKELPSQLRIISWNYDTQLELSFSSFLSGNLDAAYRNLNMISFHSNLSGFDADRFGIFKLNGSAKGVGSIGRKTLYLATDLANGNNTKFFEELLSSYQALKTADVRSGKEYYVCELSFAWEHDESTNEYYSKLKDSIKDTEVLVVIGYSFPFFNSQVDKKIINDFMPKLKKVYFQAKEPKDLKERFLAINDKMPDDKLVLRYDLDQFTFPNELDI